jgi:archaellum component FlaC
MEAQEEVHRLTTENTRIISNWEEVTKALKSLQRTYDQLVELNTIQTKTL